MRYFQVRELRITTSSMRRSWHSCVSPHLLVRGDGAIVHLELSLNILHEKFVNKKN